MNYLKCYFTEQDGAVTVDWVVLTAAIVGLGVAVCLSIAGGVVDHANGVGNHLNARNLGLGAG